MSKKRFYDAVRDLIRDVHDPPEQPPRSRRRLSISSLLAAPQTCAACWDPVPTNNNQFSCNTCLGAFCSSCLAQYARSALSDRSLLPLRCADQTCRAPVPHSAFNQLLTPEEIARLSRFQGETIRKPEQQPLPGVQSFDTLVAEKDNEDALHSLMGTMGWRRCPDCGTGIERTRGCPHMICVCGGEFCYLCGDTWRPGGLGCPRRCGLPANNAALLEFFPERLDEVRGEVWQRIAALLDSLRQHLETDPIARSIRPLETCQTDAPPLSNITPPPPSPHITIAPLAPSPENDGRPAKMRLRSLVHPSTENRL